MAQKTDLITIGPLTFVVAPDHEPIQPAQPKPQPIPRPAAPPCAASRFTMSPGVMCSDGISRMNYLAARFEREQQKGWLERLGIWVSNS